MTQAFDKLTNWCSGTRNRHFVTKCSMTNYETRYRVIVWERAEGEKMKLLPGEGYGDTLESAIDGAIANFELQSKIRRPTTASWYLPLDINLKFNELNADRSDDDVEYGVNNF